MGLTKPSSNILIRLTQIPIRFVAFEGFASRVYAAGRANLL